MDYGLLHASYCCLSHVYVGWILRNIDVVARRLESTSQYFERKYEESIETCDLQQTIDKIHSNSLGCKKVSVIS